MTTSYKLGKLPATPGAVSFKLVDYLDSTTLPKIPTKVGHTSLLPADLGMLGNDNYGDCVWAGAGHEVMLWNLEAKKTVEFTDASVLSDYSAVTGFNPNDPNTDQGTDMSVAAKYRQKTGVIDASGNRHKVAAYLALTPGDVNELRIAIYLFGAVGIGVNFPSFWMDAFNAGKSWTAKKGAQIDGGHYIPGMASASPSGTITVATWGKLQKMTAGGYKQFNDESIAYVSLEALDPTSGKSLEGFNSAQLLADLKAL